MLYVTCKKSVCNIISYITYICDIVLVIPMIFMRLPLLCNERTRQTDAAQATPPFSQRGVGWPTNSDQVLILVLHALWSLKFKARKVDVMTWGSTVRQMLCWDSRFFLSSRGLGLPAALSPFGRRGGSPYPGFLPDGRRDPAAWFVNEISVVNFPMRSGGSGCTRCPSTTLILNPIFTTEMILNNKLSAKPSTVKVLNPKLEVLNPNLELNVQKSCLDCMYIFIMSWIKNAWRRFC